MSVFKIKKNENYTVMSNYHLRDKNLLYKAKGLLSFMLSLPDNWDYSLNGLVAVSKEQITSIRSTIDELKKQKYLKIEISKIAKVKKIRIHDFRHSHASLLLSYGIPITVISKRLGHSDINMTLNTYSHLIPKDEDKAIDIINKIKKK